MNAAKAASRMRSRTAISPPSWRCFGIDALAIILSSTTLVPYSYHYKTVWYLRVPQGSACQLNLFETIDKLPRLSQLLVPCGTTTKEYGSCSFQIDRTKLNRERITR